MCAIYKKEAIEAVRAIHEAADKHDQVYDEKNITEDYELTICLREAGYNTTIGLGMYAWTEVPLSIKELWNQRIRWLRGGLDTLWQHGWNKATRRDILNTWFFWFMLLFQGTLLSYMIIDIIVTETYHASSLVVLVMGTMYMDCIYRLRYVQKIQKGDCIVRLAFIPQILYSWFIISQQLYAYYLFLFKPNQEW
jgi:poly-beta-1,6-N-acetyl-D-glucosamine synthase